MQKLSIAQASVELGISQDVIRRRLRSGELEGHQEPCPGGFRWWVELDDGVGQVNGHVDDDDARPVGDVDGPHDNCGQRNGLDNQEGMLDLLKDQVLDLREQLRVKDQQIDRLTQLLGAKALGPGADRPWWKLWGRG